MTLMTDDRGFTVVEVLIAFAIMALSLIILLSGFSIAFRGLKTSDTQVAAMRLAQSKLNELIVLSHRGAVSKSGTFDGKFSWYAQSNLYVSSFSQKYTAASNLQQLTINVTWSYGGRKKIRSVELSTLMIKPKR